MARVSFATAREAAGAAAWRALTEKEEIMRIALRSETWCEHVECPRLPAVALQRVSTQGRPSGVG